jgi:monoamine oxidase
VVGAGLGGLACAWELLQSGVVPTVYEAAQRVGGRTFTDRGTFPGQVSERGGELIDTTHRTIRGYAQEFGLTLESYDAEPGAPLHLVDGALVDEDEIIDELRALMPAMQDDLRLSSGGPTADAYSDVDVVLDHTSLDEYLDTRGAGPVIREVLEAAYVPEYGRELSEQSSLNLLYFMHLDRRSKLREFGVFSDERYHIVEGNDAIAQAMAAGLGGAISTGHRLEALRRLPSGRYRLTLSTDAGLVEADHDYVVLALPFSTLRLVSIDASVGLPAWKRRAIDELRYGTNAKVMVGFEGRPWQALGSNGSVSAVHPALQNVWETAGPSSTGAHGILTDFSGGLRGAAIDGGALQAHVAAWLDALEGALPGIGAAATRTAGGTRAILQHWPTEATQLGSYTCTHPGYFTSICGLEGERVDNLLFAGEHADLFYEWQGFMEGAAASGARAAGEILADLR